jgi:hypothetical protein
MAIVGGPNHLAILRRARFAGHPNHQRNELVRARNSSTATPKTTQRPEKEAKSMKNRKGKKRNMPNAVKFREIDRQVKGTRHKSFVIGQSCGKAYRNGGGVGGVMRAIRSMGVKPNTLTMGRNRDYTMTIEEQIKAALPKL